MLVKGRVNKQFFYEIKTQRFPVRKQLKLSGKKQLAYQKISHYLQQHITNRQAQKILEKSPATVRRHLKRLVDCGLLIAIGENKARVYAPATQKQA